MSARLTQLRRAVDQLDRSAVEAGLALLAELHDRVLAAIARSPSPAPADLPALRLQIEEAITVYRDRLALLIADTQTDAGVAAATVVQAEAARFSPTAPTTGAVGIAPTTLSVLHELSADLVTRVTDDTRAAIAREIRLAALGGRSFEELLRTIGASLDSPSIFGTLRNRAEAIARTETHRAYMTGYAQHGDELAARFPGLRKTWRHLTHRPSDRPEHVALDGMTIPWEDTFSVGGESARWPHDPRLSARQSVNCRCRLTLDFSAVHLP